MELFTLILLEATYLYIAYKRSRTQGSDAPLQRALLINMILISIFGGILINPVGLVTNVGTVFYSGVMAIQYIIMQRYGWEAGFRSMLNNFLSLSLMFLAFLVLRPLTDSSTLGNAYAVVIDNSYKFAFASFAALAIGQGVFISMYRYTRDKSLWIKYLLATIVAQAVDSLVFFPIAFRDANIDWRNIMETGFIFKAFLALIVMPFMYAIESGSGLSNKSPKRKEHAQ